MDFPSSFRRQSGAGTGHSIQRLPEMHVADFLDFSGGLVLATTDKTVPQNSSPYAPNMEVTRDGRLRRAAGTTSLEEFDGHEPKRMVVHGSLDFTAELLIFAPPFLGVRKVSETTWTDVGLRESLLNYAYANFGGTFIFTDGSQVYARQSDDGANLEVVPDAPVAGAYASWAARMWAANTVIDGRFEPLGIRWSDPDSDYRNWDGLNFELLINEISDGDRIMALKPMGFDFMAILMRKSIWVGTRTGLVERPGDLKPRVPGAGSVNGRTPASTRFGVIYLSDDGVHVFDGNESPMVSAAINPELLPLDYEQIEEYSGLYDSTSERYLLHTPGGVTWVYELERQRWFKRLIQVYSSVSIPQQTDFVTWADLVGTWDDQAPLSWSDYGGTSVGKAQVVFLGDELGTSRAIAQEDWDSDTMFGEGFLATWRVRPTEAQISNHLLTMKQFNIEHRLGPSAVELWAPGQDGAYAVLVSDMLANLSSPDITEIPATKTGRIVGLQLVLASGTAQVGALQVVAQRRGPRMPNRSFAAREYYEEFDV